MTAKHEQADDAVTPEAVEAQTSYQRLAERVDPPNPVVASLSVHSADGIKHVTARAGGQVFTAASHDAQDACAQILATLDEVGLA